MLKELLDEVKAARRAEAADKQRRARIRQLLIDVRLQRPELSVADIEEMIGRFYDRATISRYTSKAVQAERSRRAGS